MDELASRTRVISPARADTAAAISSALPTKPRATSALTLSRVRSTSFAFCLSALPMPAGHHRQHALDLARSIAHDFGRGMWRGEDIERSASPVLARTDSASSIQPGIERVGGGLGAGLDLFGHCIGAVDQQFGCRVAAAIRSAGRSCRHGR